MKDLDGKVIIVTGAAGGIGRATSLQLASRGATLVLVDVNESAVNEVATTVVAAGTQAKSLVADVTRSDDVKQYVDTTHTLFGRIDGFFNNAGIEGTVKPLAETSESDFDRVIAVNLKGVFLGLRYVLPVMLEQRSGSIVNTGSLASERGLPGTAAYNAAKHGVLGLTRTAAAEVGAAGVRVNAVLPGMVETRLLRSLLGEIFEGDVETGLKAMGTVAPLGRCAQPDEIANVVCFLLSDAACFVHGVGWAVDGGALAIMSNAG